MAWSDPHIGSVCKMKAKVDSLETHVSQFNMLTITIQQSRNDDGSCVIFSGAEKCLVPFAAIAAAINAAFPEKPADPEVEP